MDTSLAKPALQRSQRGMRRGLGFGLPDAVHRLIQIEAIAQ